MESCVRVGMGDPFVSMPFPIGPEGREASQIATPLCIVALSQLVLMQAK